MSRKLRVRQAQTVLPFGVGAVLDIQGESFVATGIGDWPAKRQPVDAPRLAARLRASGFYAAPATLNDRYDTADAAGAPYIRFPTWLFCGACRRMTRWRIADEIPGRPPSCPGCVPKRPLVPLRFVQICKAGHLSDVDWWFWAHSRLEPADRRNCRTRDRLSFRVEHRASGLEALSVACSAPGCEEAARDLLDVLGSHGLRCAGRNPWQRASEAVTCQETVQVVQRTAGNLYYPVVHSALDIPEADGPGAVDSREASQVRASSLWLALCSAPDGPSAPVLRDLLKQETDADDALLDAMLAEETGVPVTTAGALTTAGAGVGSDTDTEVGVGVSTGADGDAGGAGAANGTGTPDHPVYPDLSREEWAAFTAPEPEATRDFVVRHTGLGLDQESGAPWATLRDRIGRVVLVDRLREVRALQGFTRVSPDATFVPADTARRLRWLPAVEVYGEGVFLTLDQDRLRDWEHDPAVRDRTAGIRADLDRSFQKDRLHVRTGTVMAPRFVLLHTLAHLLIRQLSFESGYTTAGLRERVYAREDHGQAGLLVHTAEGDAAGTLGGLVQQGEAPLLAETLLRMTEAAAWCSADPLCAEHAGQGFGNLNRGACHACVVLPETSCETGNTLLDRVLVIGGGGVPGFFEDVVAAAREAASGLEE